MRWTSQLRSAMQSPLYRRKRSLVKAENVWTVIWYGPGRHPMCLGLSILADVARRHCQSVMLLRLLFSGQLFRPFPRFEHLSRHNTTAMVNLPAERYR